MKFNDIYSEASFDMSPKQKMLADIGRLLMDYAETIKDPKDEKALTLSDEIGFLGRALAEGRIRSVEQLLKLLPSFESDEQEIANVVQQVFADYEEGKRSDLATKIKHDGTADDEEENDFENPEKMQGEDLNEAEPENAGELRDKIDEISSMLEREVEWPMGDLTTDRKAKLLVRTAQQALNNLAQYADSLGEMNEGVTEASKKNFIDQLRDVVANHALGTIYFPDGSKGAAEPQTARAILNYYDNDKTTPDRKAKIGNISSAAIYRKLLDLLDGARAENVGEDHNDPGDHGEYAEREMAEGQLEFVKYACEEIDSYLQQFPMPEWFQNKLSGVHETMTKLHAYIEGQEGKMGLNDSIEEGKKKGGKQSPAGGPACWPGKKIGNPKTKMKGGKRVNNCIDADGSDGK